MIDFDRGYPHKISVDGKVIHTKKCGNMLCFYLLIIMELSVIYITIFHLFPLVTNGNYTLFILVACYLSHMCYVLLIDMIFVNQTYIDFEKKEISIINLFGKKRIFHIKEMENLKFYYRMFFWSRAFYYKIILIHENEKIVIMNHFVYKKDAKEICEFLNNFKHFDTKDQK